MQILNIKFALSKVLGKLPSGGIATMRRNVFRVYEWFITNLDHSDNYSKNIEISVSNSNTKHVQARYYHREC